MSCCYTVTVSARLLANTTSHSHDGMLIHTPCCIITLVWHRKEYLCVAACRANAPGVSESTHRSSARAASAAAAMQHVKQEEIRSVPVPTRKRDPRGGYKRKAQSACDARQGQQSRRVNSQDMRWGALPSNQSDGATQQTWAAAESSAAPQVCCLNTHLRHAVQATSAECADDM